MISFRGLSGRGEASQPREGPACGRPLSIRQIFLHVTKACNLQCAYCYFSARNPLPDELSTTEFDTLWRDVVALGPRKLVFTGGEPLIRVDLLQLIRGLRDADQMHSVLRCVNTNGHLVTIESARALVGLADEVRVSVDALRQRNDILRGEGNFDSALKALDTFHSVGFEPVALVTFTACAAPDLEELIFLLLKRGIRRINVNEFRTFGRGAGHIEWMANLHQAHASVQAARRRRGLEPLEWIDEDSAGPRRNCGVGRFLNVMPNGDVFPCHVLTQREFRCGSIREQSLLDICRSEGLLGELSALDFGQMASEHHDLQGLTSEGVCMGDMHAAKPASSGWRKHIPLLQATPLSKTSLE
jgi:MoaA/NifB/PqqE/SkfB family radical SAM enzyme